MMAGTLLWLIMIMTCFTQLKIKSAYAWLDRHSRTVQLRKSLDFDPEELDLHVWKDFGDVEVETFRTQAMIWAYCTTW
jgi:hypothetical protein